jgi:hypothetical protein
MADAPKILGTDSLRSAYPKLNMMVDLVNNFQLQVNEIVVDGDSSVEAAQARIDAEGNSFPTLKERLDSRDELLADKALKSEVRKNTDVQPINVSEWDTETKQLLTGGSVAVVGTKSTGRENIKDQAVDYFNVKGYEIGKNLFDKDSATVGKYISATGVEFSNADNYVSDFIPTYGGVTHTVSTVRFVAFYDANLSVMSGGLDLSGKPKPYTFTTPSGTRYFRISANESSVPISQYQVEKGSTQTGYESFGFKIKNLTPKPKTADIEGSVRGKNILDISKSIEGQYLNTGGVLSANSTYSTSDFILIEGSQYYVPTYQRIVAFYDASKTFISELNESSYPKNKFVLTPSNAVYMRVSYKTADKDGMQVERGNTATAYEPYGYRIPNLLVEASKVVSSLHADEEVKINLPNTLYATVGTEFNIYNANILKEKTEDYNIRYVSPSIGAQFDERFTSTPTSPGTYSLNVEIYNKTKLLTAKSVNIVVSNPRTTKKKVMVIGDSTVRGNGFGYVTQRLVSKLGSNIELIGTMGIAPNLWEGRGGWTAAKYRTGDSYDGAVNPFYNPNIDDFDFSYYMNNQGFASVDVVLINLGINETFAYTSDSAVRSAAPTIIGNLSAMINSIKSFDSNIKVALNVTIPPNARQQKFGEQKLAGLSDQTQWRYKYNNHLWVNEMISYFHGKNDLINIHASIDTENNIADHLHPTETGYNQIGDTVYSYLNSL